jgi:hypothetical protein
MHGEGVRMIFVDTASSNTSALKFFKRMGYGRPEAEVWMRKLIQRTPKRKQGKSHVQFFKARQPLAHGLHSHKDRTEARE